MNKKLSLTIVVVVVAVGLWFWYSNKDKYSGVPDMSASPSMSSSPLATQPPGRKTTGGAVFNLTYEQALAKYDGWRVQFDALCQAFPNELRVKTGTSIMFDNRSGDPRWISLNNIGYYIPGYDFVILKLTSKVLPSTTLIDCGSAQNVGQILIQK